MKFIVEVEFSEDLLERAADYGQRFSEKDRINFLEKKIEDGLEGDYYQSVTARCADGGGEVRPSQAIIDHVVKAVGANNPNDPATEEWDYGALQDLANYVAANDLYEECSEIDGPPMIDDIINPDSGHCLAYFLYDMLKWTRANNA